MEPRLHDINVRWTRDLSVGSLSMDERNEAMLSKLAAAEQVAISAALPELAGWFLSVLDQLDRLLDDEEQELAAIGYPELAFHHQLHARVRTRMQVARLQVNKAVNAPMLAPLVRDTCAALAVWLMRHVQDADKLFFPYIDARYRFV